MFESYGHEKVLQKLPIDTLENTILAIDGFWYIKKYLSISNEEQFLNVSLTIDMLLENVIELNKKTSILWVWDGIEFRQPVSVDLGSFCRDTSDKIIFSRFNKRFYDQELYVDSVTEKLRKHGVSVIRAPYSAAGQCAYFMKTCKINVFSKNDALLFADCGKLIVEIDFENSTVDVIDREVLFQECCLTLESFRRLALLSGCEYCSTYPLFASDFDPVKVIELLKRNTLANDASKSYEMSPESKYFSEYRQGFCIIENRPVMCLDGTIQPIEPTASSDAIEEAFGRRLSNKIYQQIFKCNIGAKSLSNIMFNRNKPYTMSQLVELFRTVLESPKSIEASKTTTLSEFFVKRFQYEVVWHPLINRAAQVLFHIFLNGGFKPEFLLKFLNSGYLGGRSSLPGNIAPNERLLYLSTKYSPDNLENFCMFLENYLLFMDIVNLMKINYSLENDANFDFSLASFTTCLEKTVLRQFLSQNISSSSKLEEFLHLLES